MRKLFQTVCIVGWLAVAVSAFCATPTQGQSPRDLRESQRQAWHDLKTQQRDEKRSFNQQRHTRQERKLFKQELQRERALLRSGQHEQTRNLKHNR